MDTTLRPLHLEFKGRGEVKKFHFKQLQASEKAYLYQVTDSFGSQHYEVFKHVPNTQFGVISYPGSKCFGLWAWCIGNYERALNKFAELNLN